MNANARTVRILARGEFSDHSHVITGDDVVVTRTDDKVALVVNSSPDFDLYSALMNKFFEQNPIQPDSTPEERDAVSAKYMQFIDDTKHLKVAKVRHILESRYLQGEEVWTKEHYDVPLREGTYAYVPQIEYNPLTEIIEQVRD